MSGANQLPKFALTNREAQLAPLSAIGTEFYQRVPTTLTVANTPGSLLTAQQFASDLIINAASPAGLTGPTAVQLCQFYQTLTNPLSGFKGLNPAAIGSRFQTTIQNADVVSRNIAMGAGVTPSPLTLAAGTTYVVSYELTAINPQAWALFLQIPTTGAGGGPAGIQQVVGSQGTVYNGPVFTTSVGDYTAAEIGPVTATGGAVLPAGSANLQLALNLIDVDKVTLRDAAGAVGTGATGAKDLLVATAAGDQYRPSGLVLPAQAGSMEVGPLALAGNTVQTVNGALLEARGGTAAVPLNNYIAALGGVANPTTNGFAMILTSVTAPAFGQTAATPQYGFRSILPAGLVADVSLASGVGAYHLALQTAGTTTNVFCVNSAGNTKLTALVAAGATGPLNLTANGYVTTGAIPSSRDFKHDIVDMPSSNWIQKVRPVKFQYNQGPQDYPRHGVIIEEVQEAGAPKEAFVFNRKADDHEAIDHSKAAGICWEAFTVALVKEVQQLRIEVDQLKSRVAKSDKPAKAAVAKKD